MIRKKNGEIEWLEFELLADHPKLTHGVFLRHGGVSQNSYASLNTCTAWDHGHHVEENRQRILKTLGLPRLVSGVHVHDTYIHWVEKGQDEVSDCDGLMTAHTNCGLMVNHADCQAAIFYDPIHHVVANIHAGWRGQAKNIYLKTILKMAYAFGTKPANLLVCISPSLGPDNAEFKNYRDELPEEFWRFQTKPTYFDLWAIARHQLEACGVLPHHIEIARIDTYANPEDFFSYRRERHSGRTQDITGGHGTVVALR